MQRIRIGEVSTNKVVEDKEIELLNRCFTKRGLEIKIDKGSLIEKALEETPPMDFMFTFREEEFENFAQKPKELWRRIKAAIKEGVKRLINSARKSVKVELEIIGKNGKNLCFFLPSKQKIMEIALRKITNRVLQVSDQKQLFFDIIASKWLTYEELEKIKLSRMRSIDKVINGLKTPPVVLPIEKMILFEEAQDA